MAALTVKLVGKLREASIVPQGDNRAGHISDAGLAGDPGAGCDNAHEPGVADKHDRDQRFAQQAQAHAASLSSAREAMQLAATELDRVRMQILAEAPGQLAQLALSIASKVLMQEVEAGRYKIDPIVQEAIRCLPARAEATVRLSTEDFGLCELAQNPQAEGSSVRFVADPSVPRGSCLVQSNEGVVETSIATSLAHIEQALRSHE